MALLTGTFATPFEKVTRDGCIPCNPSGATSSRPPTIGSDLKSLYTDVLSSVKGISFNKRWEDPMVPRDDEFCCAETLDCVKVENLNIPMCYDKFTTNFAFSDRSYGSLTTGNYTQGEVKVNLLTGEYTKDGSEGNIYSDDPSARPNTATLSIPPQWTSAGVGSAIPPTAIAGSVTAIGQSSGQTTGTASTTASITTSTTDSTSTSEETGSSSSTSGEGSAVASPTSSQGAAAQGQPIMGTSLVASLFTAIMYGMYGI